MQNEEYRGITEGCVAQTAFLFSVRTDQMSSHVAPEFSKILQRRIALLAHEGWTVPVHTDLQTFDFSQHHFAGTLTQKQGFLRLLPSATFIIT